MLYFFFFFFKQKTAYEIPLCDWSSDVCSSDLRAQSAPGRAGAGPGADWARSEGGAGVRQWDAGANRLSGARHPRRLGAVAHGPRRRGDEPRSDTRHARAVRPPDPRCPAAPVQQRSAALLRDQLAASQIRESHRENDPRVQDAYSIRCSPQVLGAVGEGIAFAERLVAVELNAATDNPLVFDADVLSGGRSEEHTSEL